MKILLDECVDRRLANHLVGHDVETVVGKGWAGKKNGELLTLAQNDFEVFLTVDSNLPFQQNLAKYKIAVAILRAATNRLDDLVALMPKLLANLSNTKPGAALEIDDS